MNIKRNSNLFFLFFASLLLFFGNLWAALALWIDGFKNQSLATASIVLFVFGVCFTLYRVRPYRRALKFNTIILVVIIACWFCLLPSNQRDWMPDVAHPPQAKITGSIVEISNVRNFEYKSETEFIERWENRTYDLDKLKGVDMFLSYWGSPYIAHTVTSWEFEDGKHLAISIETRKEKGESYSALLGFFRQYELYYVIADEQDVIGVRAQHKGENVFLYRIKMKPQRARELLLVFLAEANRIAKRPRWYNALRHNCTTVIRHNVQQMTTDISRPWNWRILVNGYLDELGYMRGTIDTSMPFEEMRRKSEITEKAKAIGPSAEFSKEIRRGLPGERQKFSNK